MLAPKARTLFGPLLQHKKPTHHHLALLITYTRALTDWARRANEALWGKRNGGIWSVWTRVERNGSARAHLRVRFASAKPVSPIAELRS